MIPCFNDGKTLGAAVLTAREQDEPVELVVVDDGSTDTDTLAVMEALKREGVAVVHQANAGLGRARMAGVAATQARYILPLDADDLLEPDAARVLAEVLDRDPDAGVVWGWYQRFGDESTVQPTAPTLDAWQISYQNELPATALVRRSALEQTPGWRPMNGYEDWDLWMSLAERGWAGIGLDRVIYRYRREGTRMLHQAARRHGETVRKLESVHPELFAARRRNWRRSRAPLALRLALPVIDRLPVSVQSRRLAAGAVSHLAHRRGVRLLVRRVREQGTGTAPVAAPSASGR